jgi:hypothetical protein
MRRAFLRELLHIGESEGLRLSGPCRLRRIGTGMTPDLGGRRFSGRAGTRGCVLRQQYRREQNYGDHSRLPQAKPHGRTWVLSDYGTQSAARYMHRLCHLKAALYLQLRVRRG